MKTLLLAALTLIAHNAFASDLDFMKNSFCVEIQMDENAAESGLKKEDLKNFVELELQKDGLKLFDKCTNAITVAVFATKTVIQNTNLPEFYAFAVTFTVSERAKLLLRSKPNREQVVTTYMQSATALLKKTELARLKDEALKSLVDTFSNEYLKAAH